MQLIENGVFDQERAFYESKNVKAINCRFDGEADGESAFKESKYIEAERCFFNLRYPFWHDESVRINDCEMTPLCRAALWYSRDISVSNTKMHGIKALRECEQVELDSVDILSTEFGWFSKNVKITDSSAEGEYFAFHIKDLEMSNVEFKGKYSFQYVKNARIENCKLETKDAFWHAENVYLKNCIVNGEYLAWYSKNITFENCIIKGTQPLCYCEGLRLINCEMHGADLSFEKSEVEAELTTPVISIKNPLSGRIVLPSVEELIIDNKNTECRIVCTDAR